jgi:hypothetical protein
MPKRSNQFQKLIRDINSRLSSDKVVITESKMLVDSFTGEKREVDIYIEDLAGPYRVKVSVECTAKTRKLDRPATEQLKAKHDGLDTSHLVIISKSGFAKTCYPYAKKNNIELIEFNDAESMDWPNWMEKIKDFSLSHYQFQAVDSFLTLETQPSEKFNTESVWVKSGQLGHIPIHDFIYHKHRASKKHNRLKSGIGEEKWQFDPALPIYDDNGIEARCIAMNVKFIESVSGVDLDLKYKSYMDKPIAYGVNENNNLGRVSLVALGDDTDGGGGKFKV